MYCERLLGTRQIFESLSVDIFKCSQDLSWTSIGGQEAEITRLALRIKPSFPAEQVSEASPAPRYSSRVVEVLQGDRQLVDLRGRGGQQRIGQVWPSVEKVQEQARAVLRVLGHDPVQVLDGAEGLLKSYQIW